VSLRTRLVLVVAALAAAGLLAADVATYRSERSYLTDRLDRTVTVSAEVLRGSLEHRRIDPTDLAQLAASTPGVYLGLVGPDGVPRWTPLGPGPGEREPRPQPKLPARLPALRDGEGTTLTLPAARDDARYRARLQRLRDGQVLVVAAPLHDVDAALHHLLLVDAIVSGLVLAAIVAGGLVLVRLGLRPLARIEGTAAAIAAGDLGRRVADTDARTEVGRHGRALNAMLAQIEAAFAERLASERRLRRFVGDASHELRTPLSSVQAYAELFERGARDRPADLERAMRGIGRETRRMALLVDDLLLLARLDQGRPLARARVDLGAVAGDAVDVAQMLEPERPLALEVPAPVIVEGDPERLRQVIDNLLANVRAHTPASAPATVSVTADGGTATVAVCDEGPGLDDEQAAQVFERFYRGDSSRARDSGGTGLGLAIVTAIAAAHGGVARAAGRPGGGARFTIELPLAAPPAAVDAVGEQRRAPAL
jgi:two-component system OmpR family sensor kinase